MYNPLKDHIKRGEQDEIRNPEPREPLKQRFHVIFKVKMAREPTHTIFYAFKVVTKRCNLVM